MGFPVFVFLVAAFPVMSLYAANLDQVVLTDIARSLILAELLAASLLSGTLLVLRRLPSAGALAGFVLLYFFSYGHVYSLIKGANLLGFLIGRHRYLLLLGLIAVASLTLLLARRPPPKRLLKPLNLLSLVLLAMPVGTILLGTARITVDRGDGPQVGEASLARPPQGASDELPDIYYIVPDSYARSDILLRDLGYSNSDFISHLTEQGFYIAEKSNANFLWTHQSLASSLNMQYIDTLIGGDEPGRRISYDEHIKHSLVRRELERLGYQIVAFPTGWVGTEIYDADILLIPGMSRTDELRARQALNEFESQLLVQTAIRALQEVDQAGRIGAAQFIQDRLSKRFDVQREIVLGAFENLQTAARIPGPKFVFAHIISPHRPYLFGSNGETLNSVGPFSLSVDAAIPPEVERGYYRDQLIFVTRMLQDTIDAILDTSSRPTIIIIQSDHGFSAELDWDHVTLDALTARMAILNAYYVSQGCRQGLYADISPVNSFRHILSCELGLDYPQLEDVTYIGYDSFAPLDEALSGWGLRP
jgi:hypothetical protein